LYLQSVSDRKFNAFYSLNYRPETAYSLMQPSMEGRCGGTV